MAPWSIFKTTELPVSSTEIYFWKSGHLFRNLIAVDVELGSCFWKFWPQLYHIINLPVTQILAILSYKNGLKLLNFYSLQWKTSMSLGIDKVGNGFPS